MMAGRAGPLQPSSNDMKTMAKAVCRPLAAVATALLLVGGAVSALAQNSPVGSWDMVLSGHESGVAQITFNNDFTLDGVEILTSRARKSVSEASLDPRNPSGNTGRNVSTNGSVSTNFYGKANLSGMWGFDSGGHVIGILNESGGIVTNGVSFRAVVRPGVRITVSGVCFEGRVLYRGVPLNALPDISGNYYDTGTRNGM